MKRFKRETAKPGAWNVLSKASGRMRVEPTPAEAALWSRLRRNSLGLRFRRQHAIDRFVVDFVCLRARLIVEVDGGIHASHQGEDAARELTLTDLGFRILRFTNEQVLRDLDGTVELIAAALSTSLSSTHPP